MSKIEKYILEGPHKEYRAMAFWKDNFSDAYKYADKFAGEGGRIATLPDIIDARIDGPEYNYPQKFYMDPNPWSQYFTTMTGEYFGYSKGGNPLMVVGHNVGPLATPEGIIKAYTSRLKPKRNGRTGNEGRITQKDFFNLIDGKYGCVDIIDYEDYIRRYEYPFIEALTVSQALEDPLVQARLGSRFEEYIMKHAAKTDDWADYENKKRAEGRVERFGMKITRQIGAERFNILSMQNADYGYYRFIHLEEQVPMAHLLTISQISMMNGSSLHSDLRCNSGLDSIRLVGIRGEGTIDDICPSVTIDNEIIARYLPKFFVPNTEESDLPELMKIRRFRSLSFTEYADETGKSTGEIEYLVKKIEEVDDPKIFATDIKGYHGIFRYDIKDVLALAPQGANAFNWAGDIDIEDNYNKHTVPVQFYKVSVDTTRKIPSQKELNEDFDTLMWVATQA